MSSLNKAALEVLILLKLRKRLGHTEQLMLEREIKESNDLAIIEQNMMKGLQYIQDLSHIKILDTELPAHPPIAQWADQLLIWLSLSKRWVLSIFLFLGFFGLKFYLDQAGFTQEAETIAMHPISGHHVVTLDSKVFSKASINSLSDKAPSNEIIANGSPNESKRSLAEMKAVPSKVAPLVTKKIDQVEPASSKQARMINSVSEGDGNQSGYVIRAELKTKELAQVTQSFLSELSKLSPKKAGEVELGWEKTKNIRYFHFTVADQYEPLIKDIMLKAGKLKWSKDPHPRKMPKDTIRFIIQIIESEP